MSVQSRPEGIPQALQRPHSPQEPVVATGFGWLLGRVVPNLLVLLALGCLAWWGHHTGWKLAPFTELTGTASERKDDWCEEHGVPESECVECDESLLPRGAIYGWCKVHGVQECPLEHPDVAQLKDAPRITAADFERARRALEFADRPVNHPAYKLHRRRIQFPSLDAVARAGITVRPAYTAPVVEAVAANGEIVHDPSRVATLSTPVAGRVWYVGKSLGEPVRRGEVLALVDAAEVGKAKSEFMLALALADTRAGVVERMKPVSGSSIPAAQFAQAEAELREARVRLVAAQQSLGNLGLPVRVEDFRGLPPDTVGERIQFLGLPDDLVARLDRRTATANLIPVLAPLDGVVVARRAATGEQADAGKPLFVVVDTSQVWLMLQVRQEDADLLRVRTWFRRGQQVRFRPSGAESDLVGNLDWVSTEVDEKTRTVPARASLDNTSGSLRANAFGSGRVILRAEPKAIVVPSEAVQWIVDSHVVFVRDKNFETSTAPKVFHPRVVVPGAKDGNVTEIIAGVLPGEMVVVQGSALLRSELLKNSLGEG